jgi:hypothetical protein
MVWITVVISIIVSTTITLSTMKNFKTEIVQDTIYLETSRYPLTTSYVIKDTLFKFDTVWYSNRWIDFKGDSSSFIYDSLNASKFYVSYGHHINFEYSDTTQLILNEDIYINKDDTLIIKDIEKPFIITYKERYITDEWIADFSIPNKSSWHKVFIPEDLEIPAEFINFFKKETL